MNQPGLRNNSHYFYPLTMLKNYITEMKISVEEFFKQYLKPEGKTILTTFNRYMILAMILNIDLKFLVLIACLVFIIIKLVKVKPWQNHRHSQMPLSFINKKNGIRKKSIFLQKDTEANLAINRNKQSGMIQPKFQNQKLSAQENLLTQQNTSTQLQCDSFQNKQKGSLNLDDVTISNSQSDCVELKVYDLINSVIKGYSTFIWYVKWKFISILCGLILVIFLFEPGIDNNTFQIVASHRNGQLEVESIRKASQQYNQFYLLAIWVIMNVILFYRFCTNRLKKQLLEEIYTRQYRTQLAKNTRLKTKKILTNDHDLGRMKTEEDSPLLSQKRHQSILYKNKKGQNGVKTGIDVQKLRPFSIQIKSNATPSGQNNAMSVKGKKLFQQLENSKQQPQLIINFVESEQEYEEKAQEALIHNKPDNKEKQKKSEQKQNSLVSGAQDNQAPMKYPKQIEQKPLSNKNQKLDQKKSKAKLLKKNSFLSDSMAENLLKRTRKTSQDLRERQKYGHFRLKLIRIQTDCKKG